MMVKHDFEPYSETVPDLCRVCRRAKDEHKGMEPPSDARNAFERLLDFMTAQALRELALIRTVQLREGEISDKLIGLESMTPEKMLAVADDIEKGR